MIPNSDQGGYVTPKSYSQAPRGYQTPAPRVAPPTSGGGYSGYTQRYGSGGTSFAGPSGPSAAQAARNAAYQQAMSDANQAKQYARQLKNTWNTRDAGSNNNMGLPVLPGAGNPSYTPPPNISGPGGTNPNLGGPSGGGSGIPGGGQGGPSSTFTMPKAPKAPALDTYLRSDANYQNQLRTFAQALAEFQAGQQRTTAQDNTSWQGATRQLGEQKVKDLAGIMNDFASRGMLKSGLYGQGVADYTKTYQNNLNDLNTGHSNALRDLSTANVNFQKDQAIQSAQARADAAARRAAQFGL